jgi:uncharacterized protein YcbK (DUF882 family)
LAFFGGPGLAIHFTDDEIKGLSPRLVAMLDGARDYAGVPFRITSGARTPEENQAAQGVKNTAHMRGLAVDLACVDGRERWHILTALLNVGFSRVGVYDRHIHADCDVSLPQEVIWWGKSH